MQRVNMKRASLEHEAARFQMTPLNVRTSLYISRRVEQAGR